MSKAHSFPKATPTLDKEKKKRFYNHTIKTSANRQNNYLRVPYGFYFVMDAKGVKQHSFHLYHDRNVLPKEL